VEAGKVKCPKCEQIVDCVDGEYRTHYLVANVMCTMSKREIKESGNGDDHS
jgi:hypothetical protein